MKFLIFTKNLKIYQDIVVLKIIHVIGQFNLNLNV